MYSDAARRQRVAGVAAAAILAWLMFAVAAARANPVSVTQSAITSPADPTFLLNQTSGTPQTVTISGTSNGTTGDSVDIDCYHDDGNAGASQATIATTAVSAAGNFSTGPVPVSSLLAQCRLRAVASGTTPTSGLGQFRGPRVVTATFTAGSYDFSLSAPQLTAGGAYSSAGDAGIGTSFLDDPSVFGQPNVNTFAAAGSFGNPALSGGGRPGVEVDGQPAYTPSQAKAASSGASTGLKTMSATASQDAATGDVTLTESEPLVACPGTQPPATNCAAFTDTGVTLNRTITQTSDGHVVFVTDRWSSTDGAAHTVNLLIANVQDFGRGAGGTSGVGYEFPGQAKFTEPKGSSTVSPVSAVPNSILVDSDTTADGSPLGARGAITYGQAPTGAFAFPNTVPDQGFDIPQTFTVPASGSVPLRFAYSAEFTLAGVQADARAAETKLDGAQIALTSPANGATTASTPVAVSGTFGAASGASSITVNGAPATISGSTFTVSVPLATGSNTITAVLSTGHGSSASTSETVTYAPPPPPPPPPPPAPPAIAPQATTGATGSTDFQRATVGGTLTPGTAPATYHFDWGVTSAYGHSTRPITVPASTTPQAVTALLTGLTPGTTYHYRLVVTSSVGAATGTDQSLRTAVVAPRRLTYGVSPSRDRRAPYQYTLSGRLLVPAGVLCHGSVAVLGKDGRRVVLRGSATVSRSCAYRLRVRLTSRQLHGHGTVTFTLTYRRATGFKGVATRTVKVRFG
ncbi:MAG TPA: hypothetical protein VFN55_01025 [Solirubrobacteraceae bacterium]|nr:hypothetical protein [Solirubrobacteraceae bacterium]